MSEKRLMKTPEEVRQKARELLLMPKEEVLAKYMFKEQEIERLHSIIKEVREYINKHCVNEKTSKEMGFKCYTMADTNELEHIMKLLDKENNNEDN